MRYNDMKERVYFAAFVILIAAMVGMAAWVTYGVITQHETITVIVLDKAIKIVPHTSCTSTSSTVNDTVQTNTSCTTYNTTHYMVYTDKETLSTSKGLFTEIHVNKRHVFVASGWPYFERVISRILE